MNYFELFNIPVSLKVDANNIKQKFYELSRKYHPDFFSNETEDAQNEALEKSSLINKAYKTFSNEDETVKYVLQLKNLLVEEEKYQLPSDFLMEMMELNEASQEAGSEEIKFQISNLKSQIYEPVKQIMEHYENDTVSEKELLQVKDYYYKKKYLNRILEGLP